MDSNPPLEKKPLILVVDDRSENLRLVENMFKSRGEYNVITALGGAEAIRLVQKHMPDLILLDVVMPEMDGYQVCETLKALPEYAHIPVIFITAKKIEPLNAVRGFEAGGLDYVTKPFSRMELMARIRTQLQLKFAQEAYRCLVNYSQQGMMILQAGQCRFANPKMADITGYTAQELAAMSPEALKGIVFQADQYKIEKRADRFTPSHYSLRLVRRDERVIWTNVLSVSMNYRGEPAVQLTFTDVTRLKNLEVLLGRRTAFARMIGGSHAMQRVYTLIEQLGGTDMTVLITGETGTGKELVAEALHVGSQRSKKPMVRVNCAAIPESLIEGELFGHKKGAFTGADRDKPGFFEQAEGGTLFLDEIGELTANLQAKLLRVLEYGEYQPLGAVRPKQANVRLIAATNADLIKLVEEGGFRRDMFYRLSGGWIQLPPLRDRSGDVSMLIDSFTETFFQKADRPIPRLEKRAKAEMERYPWPGNVRELKNVVEFACSTCSDDTITLSHLPQAFLEKENLPDESLQAAKGDATEPESERETLIRMLEQNYWHKSRTAKALGIARSTLYRKLNEYGLQDSPKDEAI